MIAKTFHKTCHVISYSPMYLKHLVFASLITLLSHSLAAQEGGANAPAPSGSAVSLHIGPYLPKNFSTVDTILKAVGGRYAYETGPGSYYELGVSFSNTDSHRYQDFSLSLRKDLPLADFTALALGGANLHRLQTAGKNDFTYYGGVHVGGGLLAHIAGPTYMRMEMRFNFHPGTTLFFGFGLEMHFGGGGGAAN